MLLCVGTGRNLDTPGGCSSRRDDFYLKSAAQMAALFPDQPEAIANTPPDRGDVRRRAAARPARIPHFPVPDGETVESWLRDGVPARPRAPATATVTAELQARLDYELGVIITMGYAGYFLIVADFVRFAREQRHPTTCRGSRAGLDRHLHARHHAGRPDRATTCRSSASSTLTA